MKKVEWDQFFISLTYLIASKSKDESTNYGAIIVNDDNAIVSTGYNSFPRGINDDDPSRQERPKKYFFMSHSEINAVANAALHGISTKGCRLYCNGIPCATCARTIINAGIKEVVVDEDWNMDYIEKWSEEIKYSLEMFKEAGVKLRLIKVEKLKITGLKNGKVIDIYNMSGEK